MAFLDNADGQGLRLIELADKIRDAASTALDDRGRNDLLEVVVRYTRTSRSYEEEPLILPAATLPRVYLLADLYRRTLDHVHVDVAYATPGYRRRAFITLDEMVAVEILSKPHTPEQTDEDVRRSNLRGRRHLPSSVDNH